MTVFENAGKLIKSYQRGPLEYFLIYFFCLIFDQWLGKFNDGLRWHLCESESSSSWGCAHLPLAELQHLGQPLPLRGGEVLLRVELLLQLDGLVVGEANLAALSLVQGPLDEGGPQQRLAFGRERRRRKRRRWSRRRVASVIKAIDQKYIVKLELRKIEASGSACIGLKVYSIGVKLMFGKFGPQGNYIWPARQYQTRAGMCC